MLGLATCSMLLTMLVSNPWSVHNSAGKNALLRGALEEAASEFRAAIREAEQGRQDKEIAASLTNLGEVYYEQHKFALADRTLLRADAIWRTTEGLNSINRALTLRDRRSEERRVGKECRSR